MANTTGKKFGGRQKGTPNKTRYVTINSILDSIQERLGCTYQEALADLLYASREDYENGEDKETYPKILMQLSNKVIEQARQMPDETNDKLEDLTDEELKEKQRQAVIEYIKQNGVPEIKEQS